MKPILPDPYLKHCILINKNLIVTSGSRTSALGTTGARRTLRREWTITNLPHQRGSVKLLKPVLWIQIRIRRFLAGSAIICTDSNSSIKKSKVKFEKFLRFCDFFYFFINFHNRTSSGNLSSQHKSNERVGQQNKSSTTNFSRGNRLKEDQHLKSSSPKR
jgi:hypothetical protein